MLDKSNFHHCSLEICVSLPFLYAAVMWKLSSLLIITLVRFHNLLPYNSTACIVVRFCALCRVDWSLWPCFPLGGFIFSLEAHPVCGSSGHICTHVVVWRLSLMGFPCKTADISCRVYLLLWGSPCTWVVNRLSYHDWPATLNLSISARGAMPSSLLGMKTPVGIEPMSTSFWRTPWTNWANGALRFVCVCWVDWSLWPCFPLGGFICSCEDHPVRGSSGHLHSCGGVEVNPDGHPLQICEHSSPCLFALFKAHPAQGWCADCPTIMGWQHLI